MIHKPLKWYRLDCLFVLLLIFMVESCNNTARKEYVDDVNPLIGTTMQGNVCPNVGMPFGMTQWTPQTRLPKKKGIPPYLYYDPMIQGFQGSHWLNGGATQDYGSVTLMPITGDLKVMPQKRASSFSHEKEVAKPYYYKVTLSDYHVVAELTGTSRSGFMRFHYPHTDSSYVIIDTNAGYQPTTNKTKGDGFIKIIPDKKEVVGYDPVYRMYQGWGQPAGFSGYFVIKFNRPFKGYGTWNAGHQPRPDSTVANNQPGAFIHFNTKSKRGIKVKIGTSFTSIAEARNNLKKEIPEWNFSRVKANARRDWQSDLGRIRVKGGTPSQKSTFYTALYHAFQLPRTISDIDGSYVQFDSTHTIGKLKKGAVQYGDYSLWDTFRAQDPLLTLLEPDRMSDIIASLIRKGKQGGYLPIFPAWGNYTSEMIGDHAVPVIVDAYMKGIRGFDVKKAYQLIKKNATRLPNSNKEYISGKGRRALKSYIKYGYIPLEDSIPHAFHHNEQVSRTLAYAYDDWNVAQMAHALHHPKDYNKFSKRAQNFKNVFDTTTGFVRGRHADGSWAKPFNPAKHSSYITEGTPWQYTWFVPQHIRELIQLMGGREKFVSRLTTFFQKASKLNPGFRNTPYYTQGNEPDESAVYLFDYAGAPWKTQYWVRQIMKRSYQDNAGGLPGNEDAGQMSAWYVFSAIGLYPVCPGKPVYAIGSPLFRKITIDVGHGRQFTIRARKNSRSKIYVQSARLNGKKLNKPFISHSDITNGGTLTLIMGKKPNKKWGIK